MAEGAALVHGHVLAAVDAYGKHLFYRFGDRKPERATTLHVHLGLFGKFARHSSPGPIPKDTVRMRLENDTWTVDLTGPTDCRIIEPNEERAIRDRLGPDPLRADAEPDLAFARLKKRKSSIGEALMDQKVLAGVGNVYRAESLFVHGIHPMRPANTLAKTEWDALWSTIVAMLRDGVKDQRMITVSKDDLAELGTPRSKIRPKEGVYVYKKERCLRCGTGIARWDLAGRWAYACPTCQPS